MAQENFNVSEPNDGLGDKLRAAFIKVQSNFTDLFIDKVDKEAGKGLSTNDYTNTEKTKLANIEDFAEVNVQSDFLQQDDTQDDFIKNKPEIPVLGDYLLNGGYIGTAQDIEDSITLQQATAGANKNLVDGIFQAGTNAGDGQSGINVNQFGNGAGVNNTGDFQNSFGEFAGTANTGSHQNAFGNQAGNGNTGENQNAFGAGAGVNNTFNDVNLFGENTQADENGQTVFRSAGGFMVRLSTLLLTATRKYIWPNKSGTVALLDDIPEAGQLVKVTENGQTGYRLKDANPANYADIGQDAVDLSISTSASNTMGATGSFSNATGFNTTASGFVSNAEGVVTIASGSGSSAKGNTTISSGFASHSQGRSTFARSFGEHSGGINGTDYTPQGVNSFNLIDRLVNYGNGLNESNRSDAYTLFKNGMQKFFTAALSTITNATKGSVMLDENARMNVHDGFNFNQVAYTAEVLTKQNQKLTRGVSFTAENEQIYSITQTVTITNPTGVAGRGYEFEVLSGTTTVGARTFGVGSYVKAKFQGGVFVYNVFKDEKDLISKWASAVNGTEVANTLTITPTYSQLIPAGTFLAGDVFSIYARGFSQNAKSSATSIYIYINTVNNLDDATQLAISLGTATLRTLPIERTFTIKGSTTRGLGPTTNNITDVAFGASQTAFTIDWTIDQFIIIAIGHTVADQSMRGDFFRITK